MPGLGSSISLLGDTTEASAPGIAGELYDGFRIGSDNFTVAKRYNVSDAFGIGVAPAQTPLIRPGRIIDEALRVHLDTTVNLNWTVAVAEQIYTGSSLKVGSVAVLNEGVGMASALTASLAVTVLQGLGIAPVPTPSLIYTKILVQGIGVSDAFRNFFGGELSDGIGVTEVLAQQFRAYPEVSDGIGIAAELAQNFYIRVTMSDTIGVADDDVLNLIYNGELSDEVQIVAGYVSPDGQFTTWAINTRSGAVTEYDNYAFNSFARIGNSYIGASSSGLYELIGDDDDGANIVAQIKSGFAQWAGSRFTMFKGIYLGVRGEGDFVLKLETGDGKTYNYAVATRNQRTTKIHLGKGLKARYWAFELISTGQDFDLDTIEFVPLVSDRRV